MSRERFNLETVKLDDGSWNLFNSSQGVAVSWVPSPL